jgi:hypothetical protein
MGNAINEVIRYEPPLRAFTRFAARRLKSTA